jgi:uncharacterized protein DUF4266
VIHPRFVLEQAARGATTIRMVRRWFPLALTMGVLASVAGCSPPKAIERGPLTHPTMTSEEIAYGLDGHVRAVSEGAAGGLAGGGGGCGCN